MFQIVAKMKFKKGLLGVQVPVVQFLARFPKEEILF